MENGDICARREDPRVRASYDDENKSKLSESETHIAAVGVDDADTQGTVLHVALEVEHGALSSCHGHVQLSCEEERAHPLVWISQWDHFIGFGQRK